MLSKPQINLRKTLVVYLIIIQGKGYLLVIVSSVNAVKSKYNLRVPFFFVTNKARAPYGDRLD